ncbi:hypothetical protein Trydic_g7144 [Trypoxylus dichotomus]
MAFRISYFAVQYYLDFEQMLRGKSMFDPQLGYLHTWIQALMTHSFSMSDDFPNELEIAHISMAFRLIPRMELPVVALHISSSSHQYLHSDLEVLLQYIDMSSSSDVIRERIAMPHALFPHEVMEEALIRVYVLALITFLSLFFAIFVHLLGARFFPLFDPRQVNDIVGVYFLWTQKHSCRGELCTGE